MTVLTTLATEASSMLAAGPPIHMQQGGILDWIDSASGRALTTARGVALAAAVIFVIIIMVTSKMAMTRVILAGLSAGVFVWIIYNVTEIRDRVDTEVNASTRGGITQVVESPPETLLPSSVA